MKTDRRDRNLIVSFSGGRTSAYMCAFLLEQSHHWRDVKFVFANTGQEHEETLVFVEKCDKYFGLNLTWVEAVAHHGERKSCTHRIVDFNSACRSGAVFEDVIAKYGIPNKAFPLCTRELKINPMKSWAKSIGWTAKNSDKAIGIRMDEIDRMAADADKAGIIYPLIESKSGQASQQRRRTCFAFGAACLLISTCRSISATVSGAIKRATANCTRWRARCRKSSTCRSSLSQSTGQRAPRSASAFFFGATATA